MNGIHLINIGINLWGFLFFESTFLKTMNAECTLIDKILTDPEKDLKKKMENRILLKRYHQV